MAGKLAAMTKERDALKARNSDLYAEMEDWQAQVGKLNAEVAKGRVELDMWRDGNIIHEHSRNLISKLFNDELLDKHECELCKLLVKAPEVKP
jgi:predicted nuclease with TOPRIM domain